jgi:hypothetical protein
VHGDPKKTNPSNVCTKSNIEHRGASATFRKVATPTVVRLRRGVMEVGFQ